MDADQEQRAVQMDAEGKSSRQIAAEPGMPSHTTIQKWLTRRKRVSTPLETPETGNPPEVETPEKEYFAFGAPRRAEDSPIVKLSLTRSLVGMNLSPKELLDAKDAGALPKTAFLDARGRVEIRKLGQEPLWPAYGPPESAKTPSGNKFMKLRYEGERPAHRTNDRG